MSANSSTPSSNPPSKERYPAFAALRHRDFRLLWLGQIVSVTGSQMQLAAVQLARLVADEIRVRAGDGGILSRRPNHLVFTGWRRVCRRRGSQAADDRDAKRDAGERHLPDHRDHGGPEPCLAHLSFDGDRFIGFGV